MIKRLFSIRPDWQVPALLLALTFALTGCGGDEAGSSSQAPTERDIKEVKNTPTPAH